MAEPVPEFWDDALEVIRAVPIAFLATAFGDQASVRAVTPAYVGTTAYIATDPETLKVRSIEMNPLVELLHWNTDFRHVNVRGRASMLKDEGMLAEMWDKFGYDLSDFFEQAGETDESTRGSHNYGLMQIVPFRLEMTSLQRVAAGKPPLIWRSR